MLKVWGLIILTGVLILVFPDIKTTIVLIIALILMAFGLNGIIPYHVAKRWIKVKGTIEVIKEHVEEVWDQQYSATSYYYPLVKYIYNYDGNNYKNDRVSFEKQNIWTDGINLWGDKLPESDKPWHEWVEGKEIDVYINPKTPQESVLIPFLAKKRRSHHLALILSGVIVFVLWMLLK